MLLGRYTDALRNFDMAAKISLSLNDGEMEVLSLLGKSRALAVSGDAKSASEVFSAAADKAETGIFQNLWVVDYLKAFVSYKMADVLAAMGDRELAVKRLQYARLLNYDFALEEKIFKLMSGLDEALHAGIEEIYRLLAEAHTAFEIRDYSNMHKAAASALDKARAMHFRKGIFEAEHALANALTGMGDYKAALDYALHTEDLAESGNDYTRRILSFNLAGDIYMLLKDNERASAEYGKSLSLARVRGNRFDEEKAMARIKQAGLAEASDNISQARPFP
jgi:tetratricopeptide (TPR) repeat protein